MAYNSVPLGEAGTGAAFILPQGSVAADRTLDTIDYNNKIAQKNQENKQAQAAARAQSYKENAFKAKNGTLWNSELMGLQQKHLQQGSDYAKQGIDIYNPNPNDPEQMAAHDQYMSDRAKLYDMQDVRDQLSTHLLEQDKKAAESPAGTFDADSINNLHGFYSKNTLRGIVDGGFQAPYLQEAFDPEKNILSKVEPVMTGVQQRQVGTHNLTTNDFKPKATAALVDNMYQSTPGGISYVQKQTGITPQDAKQIPDNLQDVTDLNDHQFKNTPQGQQALVQAGITSYSDPKYQQLLQQKSQSDFQAKQKYNQLIQQGVDRARAKAKIENKDVRDYSGMREAREEADFAEKQKAKEGGDVVFGNQQSNVPVLKQTMVDGKVVPQKIINAKGKADTANSTVEPEQGATLFSQAFPQTKITATPGTVVTLKDGHALKNTTPFEVTAGSVKMEPVFTGLDAKDSRNGAVMSKRQLMELVEGKSKLGDLSNLNFQPMVYGDRPTKDKNGKTVYEPVAFPYDAIRGNPKLKTTKFDETEKDFHDLINSEKFKQANGGDRMKFLSTYYNWQ